jgi:hypothetical protein
VFVEGEFSFVDLGSELLGYRRFDDSVQLLCIINASSDVLVYYNEQGMNPVFAHEVVTQEPSYLELPPGACLVLN